MGNGCWKQVYKIIKIIYKYTFIMNKRVYYMTDFMLCQCMYGECC